MLLYPDTPPSPSSVQLTPSTPQQMQGPSGPAPLPPIQVPPQPSWLDRIESGLMPTPRGFEGLLSNEDLKHARRMGLLNFGLSMLDASHNAPGLGTPSFGAALAKSIPAAQNAYQQDITGNIQQQNAAVQMAQQRQILLNRIRVAQQYGPQPNETPDQTAQRLKQMYIEYLRAGDTDMAGKLGEVVSKLFTEKPKVSYRDLGDRTAVLDENGNVIRYEKNGPKPKSAEEVSAQDRFNATQTNSILDDYRTDSKVYHTALDGYRVLQGALQSPNMTTPFAALDAYARVINPGASVRLGTMAVLQEMGSYDQKLRRWLDMATQGQWPAEMLGDIKNRLDAVMRGHYGDYQDARKRAILRGKMLGLPIEPLLDSDVNANGALFGSSAPAASPNGSKGNASKVAKAGSSY